MQPIFDCQKCGHPIYNAIVNGKTVLVNEWDWDEETDERIENEWNECPACGTQDWQQCLHPDYPDDRVDELMDEFCKPCPLCFEWECSKWARHCHGCHRNLPKTEWASLGQSGNKNSRRHVVHNKSKSRKKNQEAVRLAWFKTIATIVFIPFTVYQYELEKGWKLLAYGFGAWMVQQAWKNVKKGNFMGVPWNK